MMEALLREEEEVWLHKCGHSFCDDGAFCEIEIGGLRPSAMLGVANVGRCSN
jgi:hypothetical protein